MSVISNPYNEHFKDLIIFFGSAKEAGLTFLNEVGLDPGIDHLLALECIHNVQNHGGRIDSFVSYCGGTDIILKSNNFRVFIFILQIILIS